MAALQHDDLNPMAARLVPYLLDVDDLGSGYYRDGQDLLRSWDFHQPPDSAAAAYYNAVWRALLARTFHDELRESLWPEGGQRWFAVVTGLLADPTASWWDDEATDGDGGDPRRHAARGDAGRPRRADQPAGAARGGLDLG